MGKIQAIVTGAALAIIGLIILVTVLGELTDDVTDAGDSIRTCPADYTYNSSGTAGAECYEAANLSNTTGLDSDPPLSGLYDNNSALPLVFLGMAFIGLLMFMVKGLIKRN